MRDRSRVAGRRSKVWLLRSGGRAIRPVCEDVAVLVAATGGHPLSELAPSVQPQLCDGVGDRGRWCGGWWAVTGPGALWTPPVLR